MGTVLIRLAEHLRLTHRTGGRVPGLAHLTVVEEAHRLLRRPEPNGDRRRRSRRARGRAVRRPARGDPRLRRRPRDRRADPGPPRTRRHQEHGGEGHPPAPRGRRQGGGRRDDERDAAQSRYLVTLPPGQAAVFSDGMDFPVLVKIKDGTEREAASPVPTADARTVVHPRSGTCGSECAARPCTLREMRRGQRALDDLPWLRQWAELAVLAHLTGWPVPVPGASRARRSAGTAAATGPVRPRPRDRRGRGRASGDRPAGRPRRARGGGDPRASRMLRVAVPARRAGMAARGGGDGGCRSRRRPPLCPGSNWNA